MQFLAVPGIPNELIWDAPTLSQRYGAFVVQIVRGDHTVSAQENEALVRWFFEEAWGKGNLAAVDEYVAADHVEHTLPPQLTAGARRPKAVRCYVP